MQNMTSQADAKEQALSRQARFVSIVIAGTMILWMAAQWLGGKLGVAEHYVFLADLFALAGFLWALIVTFQIWRKRRAHG
ncbi:MAG: DUF5337 domain-containing protein [Silicimonas sp.]|nr:DUF5337 domain-containing protein [Silicimonas sp.]